MLTFLTTYLIAGIIVSEIANRGPLGVNATQYIMGCLIWPLVLLVVLVRIFRGIMR